MASTPAGPPDALLGLLLPFWQLVIALGVLAAVVVAGLRLARRGPSRLTTAVLLTGAGVVALCAVGILLSPG